MTEQQPTSGVEWRKMREQGVLVELPSGFNARLRSISFETVLLADNIPEPIAKAIAEIMLGKDEDIKLDSIEDIKNGIKFGQIVCKTCFVSPKIVDNPTADDEISVEDLITEDINFVTRLLYEPAAKMAIFHPGESEEMETPAVGTVDVATGHSSTGKRTRKRAAVGE
jgi:hypothetical protein